MKDPDNLNNWISFSYLEKRIPEFNKKREDAMNASKRDLMKYWQNKWMEASRKKNVSEMI